MLLIGAENVASDSGASALIGAFLFVVTASWLSQIGGEWLKRSLFAPRITLLKDVQIDGLHVKAKVMRPDIKDATGNVQYLPAEYVRIAVKNEGRSVAVGCRLFLKDIRFSDGSRDTPAFRDYLQLRRAYEQPILEPRDGVDLPIGAVCHFDIASVQHDGITVLEFASKTALESPEFLNRLKPGRGYRLEVVFTSGTTPPKSFYVAFSVIHATDHSGPGFSGVSVCYVS